MNLGNKNELETDDIINVTETIFLKKECNDIGNKWTRECPNCNTQIVYKNKYKLAYAIRDNTWCNKCWRNKRRNTTFSEFYKNCPKCNKVVYLKNKYCLQKSVKNNSVCHSCIDRGNVGRIQTAEEKEMRAIKLRCKKRSIDSKKKYSSSKIGNRNPRYGDHRLKTEEHKRKIRISCIKYLNEKLSITNKSIAPRFNPMACKIIDEYGRQNGYNFQHAMNGGEFYIKELGYWVDGYDKEKNVVIEYFENNHWHRKNKKKDLDRCYEICQHLGCELIILREEVGGTYLPEYIH